jgi:polyferredoxin
LLLIVSALVALLATRDDVDVTILRTQGMVYQNMPGGYIANLYSARMFNKTHKDIKVKLSIPSQDGSIEIIGAPPLVAKENYAVVVFLIKKKASLIKKRNSTILIQVQPEGQQSITKKTSFIGPVSF